MKETKGPSQAGVSSIAYIAATLFAIRFLFFFLPFIPFIPRSMANLFQDGTLAGAILSLAEHLVLFPIVAALPTPQWARAAGYGWLVIDMSTDIMALNHVPAAIYLALRYGGHISAVLWVASASWQAKGVILVIGWLYALDLGSFSFLNAYGVSPAILIPSAFLFPAWLVLVGRISANL